MSVQQVEIVKPNLTPTEATAALAGALFGLGIRVLIIWWAIVAWFPEFGLTYWQIILPVYALRMLILPAPDFKRLRK